MSKVHALLGISNKILGDVSRAHNNEDARHIAVKFLELGLKGEALLKMARQRNPMTTPEAHFKKVDSASRQFKDTAVREIARLKAYYETQRKNLLIKTDTKAGLIEPANASEIRAAFRGLSADQRATALNQALGKGQGDVIAALTSGASLLTSIPEDEYSRYRDVIRTMKATDELAAIESLDLAFEQVPLIEGLVSDVSQQFTNSELVMKITEQEKAALEAEAAFSQTLTLEGY